MTKIALIEHETVHNVWTVPDGETEVPIRYELPYGKTVSPVYLGWTENGFDVVSVTEFVVPSGKQISGPAEYTVENGQVTETYPVVDAPVVRSMVRKSVVQQRLIDAGLIGAAKAALDANPAYFARWFAPDRPAVYRDDPDALLLLQAIGADPAVIMAEEE